MGSFGRIGAVVLTLALCSVVALSDPPDAAAYTGAPSDVITNPANWGGVYDLATGKTTYTPTSSTAPVLGRALSVSGVLGTAGLAAAALGTGYLIGGGINRWFSLSCRISSTCTSPSGTGVYNARFFEIRYDPTSGVSVARPPGGPSGTYWVGFNVNKVYWYDYITSSTTNGVFGIANPDRLANNDGKAQAQALEDAADAWVAASGVGTVTGGYCSTAWCSEIGVPLSAAQVESIIKVDSPPVAYTSQPYTKTVTIPADPGTGSGTATAIRDELLSGDDETDVAIAMLVDPTYEGLPPAEFTMPDCEGETYASCLALLEALGYVGSITTNELGIDDAVLSLGGAQVVTTNPGAGVGSVALDDPITFNVNPDPLPLELAAQLANETATAYLDRIGFAGSVTYTTLPVETSNPALGPSAPVRVTAPAPTSGTRTITVPAPGDPAPDARIPNEVTTEITVEQNAPSMPPVDASTGTCDPWLSADLDLSPLTGVALGDKFPFGVFAWADEWLDGFTTSAVAPSWSFSTPSLAGQTVPTFDIDLDWLDDYMSTFRTLISWALWVGAVWFLASSMLGLRLRGDPADAVDDVL